MCPARGIAAPTFSQLVLLIMRGLLIITCCASVLETWDARARHCARLGCADCRKHRPFADLRMPAIWPRKGGLRLRGGGPLSSTGPPEMGKDRQKKAAGSAPSNPEVPVFRYVPYVEKRGRLSHRKSKMRRKFAEEGDEEEELMVNGEGDGSGDVPGQIDIDEDRVKALLLRQRSSAKSLRRKEARRKEKDMSTTLEQMARFDPRKRTGEEWVNAEMRGQSFHAMRQEVIEVRARMEASLMSSLM